MTAIRPNLYVLVIIFVAIFLCGVMQLENGELSHFVEQVHSRGLSHHAIDYVTAKNKTDPGLLRIAHVVNFYSCDGCPEMFRPLNQAQNVTFGSMKRALKNATKSIPTVYVAAYEQDGYIIPNEFTLLSIRLSRTTTTEYPHLDPKLPLPFVDDILSSLYDSSNTKAFDYVVYTNSDIALQYDFYDQVAGLISEGYDGFAVNRRIIPMERDGNPLTSNDLDLMYSMSGGKSHPGTDCIVFKKDLYRKYFEFGNVFLGFPPLGSIFRELVTSYSENFRWFKTQETNMTFHLGHEKAWAGDKGLKKQNEANADKIRKAYLKIPDQSGSMKHP